MPSSAIRDTSPPSPSSWACRCPWGRTGRWSPPCSRTCSWSCARPWRTGPSGRSCPATRTTPGGSGTGWSPASGSDVRDRRSVGEETTWAHRGSNGHGGGAASPIPRPDLRREPRTPSQADGDGRTDGLQSTASCLRLTGREGCARRFCDSRSHGAPPAQHSRALDRPKGRSARGSMQVGVGHIQEDSVARRVQVPRGRLLRERGGSFLPLPDPRLGTDPWYGPHPDARDQRRALHRSRRPLLDRLVPRFHPKMEKPFDPPSGDDGRKTRGLPQRGSPPLTRYLYGTFAESGTAPAERTG